MIITVIMLSIALCLVIGVIIPLLNHAREIGTDAHQKGEEVGTRLENILK